MKSFFIRRGLRAECIKTPGCSFVQHPGVNQVRELLLKGFASIFPTSFAGGEVLDVGVAQFFGLVSGLLVGAAFWAATIGDDQGVLVSWKKLFKLTTLGLEVNGGWHAALGIGIRAIDSAAMAEAAKRERAIASSFFIGCSLV
jgi:hypothetical protein